MGGRGGREEEARRGEGGEKEEGARTEGVEAEGRKEDTRGEGMRTKTAFSNGLNETCSARVAIVDFDAHHGNGCEQIMRDGLLQVR